MTDTRHHTRHLPPKQATHADSLDRGVKPGAICPRCGAWRGEHGLEPQLEMWLANEVAIWREIRRVLRKDGVAWLNCGDAYNSNQDSGFDTNQDGGTRKAATASPKLSSGLKPKQRLMLPARLALALQADGWWLRDEVILHKENPMPSSVQDRTTPAHEMLYMLTRSPRYFYDKVAIEEAASGTNDHDRRNKRSVWSHATSAFSGAHFATANPAWVETCVLAGTSAKGCCAHCGAPWWRVVNKQFRLQSDANAGVRGAGMQKPMDTTNGWEGYPRGTTDSVTTGWRAGCSCNAAVVPCTVLDPFWGSSTTSLVAERLGRNSIGIELNPAYVEIGLARLRADSSLFLDVEVVKHGPDARARVTGDAPTLVESED